MRSNLKTNPLSPDQQRELSELNTKDRVTFIRELFWNGLVFDEEYTKVLGLEDFGTTDENMEHFLMGATAMFDYAQMRASNHWHGHPEKDKLCQMENDYLYATMDSAFEEINPLKMYEWKEISKLHDEIFKLKQIIKETK